MRRAARSARSRPTSGSGDLVRYRRMPIEVESPEQLGYDTITNNLSESSVADRRLADLGPRPRPRRACCSATATTSATRRCARPSPPAATGCRADDVLVTPGAAAALFASPTSLLEPGDHAVVVRTNYATNLETPRAIGADVDVVDLALRRRLAARRRRGWPRASGPAHQARSASRARTTRPGTMLELDAARAGRARRALRRGAARRRDLPRPHPRATAADGRDAVAARGQRVRRCRRPTACPACASAGRCAATRRSRRRCSRRRSRWSICGADPRRGDRRAVLADRAAILPPILDDVRARLAIVQRLAGRAGHVRVGRADAAASSGSSGSARDRGRRHRPLLRRAARRPRHLRRARATGSRSTTATSGSATAGPRRASYARPGRADRGRPGHPDRWLNPGPYQG